MPPGTDAAPPTPRLPRWALVLFGVVGMFTTFIGAVAMWPLTLIAPLMRAAENHAALGVSLGVLQHVLMALGPVLLVWLVVTYLCRRPLRTTGLFVTRLSVPLFLLGIVIAVLIEATIMVAMTRAGAGPAIAPAERPGWAGIVTALSMGIIMQGFPEELLFRGYVLSLFEKQPIRGLIVSSGVFGLLHLLSNSGQNGIIERFAYLALPTGFAFLAGALVLYTRSLWTAVGIHGGSHAGVLVASLLGAGEGSVTQWLLIGAAYFAAGAVVLSMWTRRGDISEIRFEH